MSLQNILGQDQAIHILGRALRQKRVAPAYLFYGPESVGKKYLAREFAKALNCLEGSEDACGVCSSCRKIEQGIHPDVFIVNPTRSTPTAREETIKIDVMRELQKKLGYLPYEGKTKVAIVDGAEKMNPQAANSFLKTLEEPPSATTLILITPNAHQLLPTLVSRCQGIKFNALPVSVIRKILLKDESEDMDPSELDLRVIRSQGQVARAFEEDLLASAEYRKELIALIDLVSLERVDLVFRWCREVGRDSAKIRLILLELMGLIRDLAVLQAGCPRSSLLNRDLENLLRPVAGKKSRPGLVKMMNTVQNTQAALAGNANIQLTLENMLLQFCEAA